MWFVAQKAGYASLTASDHDRVIENIVARFDLRVRLDLEAFAVEEALPETVRRGLPHPRPRSRVLRHCEHCFAVCYASQNVVYEPEVYAGLLFQSEALPGSTNAVLYPSGIVLLTRAKVRPRGVRQTRGEGL
jgi:TATA-box binding protein (TBP) (component of TFIID and TFIIIB)